MPSATYPPQDEAEAALTGFNAQVTFIYTKDLEKSAAFYEDHLGLTLVQIQDGGCRLYRVSERAFLGLCRERDGRVTSTGGLILCMVTDAVDIWYDTLLAAGVDIEAPPSRNPDFQIYHFFFRDPDGHLLEIQRFDDPAWAEDWVS